ncbi:MAG TPA: L,D-transpeptidase [Candidatus Binatia bacterium]|jgi:lipoprotein-anchoring transpeptidase ErfK/SrfK|nr:L,D-transpeptidase [Candidatus Binatia bacterium]
MIVPMGKAPDTRLGRAVTAVAVVLLAAGLAGCGPMHAPPPRPEPQAVVDPGPGYPHLLLKLSERKVYLVEEKGKSGEAFPVAIGKDPYFTPVGTFRVNEMVKDPDWVVFDFKNPSKVTGRIPPGPKNPLGLRWIGFASAHGWEVGFHGTSKPELLGQAVSHGCVRMKNSDVVKVFDKVKIGTTVIVEP